MPTLSNVGFGLLLTNGCNNLTGDFINWHYPKQPLTFCHCCVNETWTNICNSNLFSTFVSLLT